MEPGHEGREELLTDAFEAAATAAMEPGHEGREELARSTDDYASGWTPQWSPAMKAGKRRDGHRAGPYAVLAAMEPGHEGREEPISANAAGPSVVPPQWSPAMKAGKSRRDQTRSTRPRQRRNGARP